MRETEIVKGLAQAKRNMFAKGMVPRYADGVVPPEKPSIMGFIKDRTRATMQAILPGTTAMAQGVGLENQGMLGDAARGLRDNASRTDAAIKQAEGYATGTPFIKGPGTGTSDSVPAMLSKGEAVLPAKTVQHIGPNNIARLIEQTNGIAPKRGLSGRMDSGSIGSDNWTHSSSGGADSGTIGGFATGYVDDPVARAAQNRVNVPTPTPAPSADIGMPELKAPVEAPPTQSGLFNSIKQRASGIYNAARGTTPVAAADAVAPAAAGTAGASTLGGVLKSGRSLALEGLGISDAISHGSNAISAIHDGDGLRAAAEGSQALSNISGPVRRTVGAADGALKLATGSSATDYIGQGIKAAHDAIYGEPKSGTELTPEGQRYAAIMDKNKASAAVAPAAPTQPQPQPQPQPQTGSIGGAASAAGAGEIQNPQAPLQALPAPQARNLDSAIRNRTVDSTDFQPGTGVVVANGNGGSAPRAIQINDNRGGLQRQVQDTQPSAASPYDAARKMLADSQFSDSDGLTDRVNKISLRKTAMALIGTVDSEQNQKNTRYSTDRGYDAAILNKNIARAQYLREVGNDNGKRIDGQLDIFSKTTDKNGHETIDPDVRKDLERKVIGTFGKNGITKNDISQDQLSEFLNYYDANKQDPGILQKLDNFVKDRKTVTSNDVTGARDIGAEPGVLVDSTVQANGNRVPTSLRHGQNIFGIGPANADIRDLDKATQAHYKKYGF